MYLKISTTIFSCHKNISQISKLLFIRPFNSEPIQKGTHLPFLQDKRPHKFLKRGDYVVGFCYGSHLIQKKILIKLKNGGVDLFQKKNIEHDLLIGSPNGIIVRLDIDLEMHFVRSTFEDFLEMMPKSGSCLSSEVMINIVNSMCLQPNDNVLEIGEYSGLSTLLFSQAVGRSGNVHTINKNAEKSNIARTNYYEWSLYHYLSTGNSNLKNVTFHNRHFHYLEDYSYKNIDKLKFDVIFINTLNFHKNEMETQIKNLSKKLKICGFIGFYTDNPINLFPMLQKIDDLKIPFIIDNVWEENSGKWKCFRIDNPTDLNDKQKPVYFDFLSQDAKHLRYYVQLRLLQESVFQEREYREKVRDPTEIEQVLYWKESRSIGKLLKTDLEKDTEHQLPLPESNDSTTNRYDYGNHIMISPVHLSKNGRRERVLDKLQRGGVTNKTANTYGAIGHDLLVINGAPGCVVSGSKWHWKMFTTLPKMAEFLDMANDSRSFITSRIAQKLCFFANIHPGNHVVEFGSVLGTLSLYLSLRVWEQGQVSSFIDTERIELEDYANLFDEWISHFFKTTKNKWPNNIIQNRINENTLETLNKLKSNSIDAVVLSTETIDKKYLSSSITKLKKNKFFIVTSFYFYEIQDFLDYVWKNNLPLAFDSLYEDRLREHLFMPPYVKGWPPTVQPRLKLTRSQGHSGFILRMRKISSDPLIN